MQIEQMMEQVNGLLKENKVEEAEQCMLAAVTRAQEEGQEAVLLQLYNELMGFYRDGGRTKESYAVAQAALRLAEQMGLAGTVAYATTLQNAANAYRAGGDLQDSLQAYEQAAEIYHRYLAEDDMLVAALHNNMSLLYQEMRDFTKAKEELLKALEVVRRKEAAFEIAATYTNLASTCMELSQLQEAFEYALQAVESFRAREQKTTHYCGALTALGSCYYEKKEYEKALECFREAREIMSHKQENQLFISRLQERMELCEKALEEKGITESSPKNERNGGKDEAVEPDAERTKERPIPGMELCKDYYKAYGAPMLQEKFPEYVDRIAVGLVGPGSDCFGYDDAFSRDHDFGPGFCMWVSDEVYDAIGQKLQQAYEELPVTFRGITGNESMQGKGRRGVKRISAFYQELLGAESYEEIDWQQVSDSQLAAAVNGLVFRDAEGLFTEVREKLQAGYPARVQFLRMAQAAGEFAQCGQYNYQRMSGRGDKITAGMMLSDALKAAMKLQHYIENRYPVHDKWLYRSLQESENGRKLAELIQQVMNADIDTGERGGNGRIGLDRQEERITQVAANLERIGGFLAQQMYAGNFISDTDSYLDAHTGELVFKASVAEQTVEQLSDGITKLEFRAFDRVRNVGGRASCQNDYRTFSIMRKSQYLTWDIEMLRQYYYDFSRELEKGHNLIEEKYGRMMESTAPAEYEAMKHRFPVLSPEKQAIIGQIVELQVAWMEEFAARYPKLAGQARSVRSQEDHLHNTSYETYLRGEISTYSDKMLELYGRYVVTYAREGRNVAFEIMEKTTGLYGYESLDVAEKAL